MSRIVLVILAFSLFAPVDAAPPTLTSIFPAGGQLGTTVEFTASGAFDKWPVDAWTSQPQVVVKPTKDRGKFTATIAADAKPGTTWIRLHNTDGASPLRPFLLGVLPEMLETEPNDEVAKPQIIERSCVVNGKLGRGNDVDLFAVKLDKGQTLVASLEANYLLRSPMDAVMQIVSAQGFVLEQSHDHRGLDPQIAFTAPKDGQYLVRLFAFPSQPDSSIRFFGSELCVYRLTLTTAGFEDFPIPLAMKRGSNFKPQSRGWNLSIAPVVPAVFAVREETHECYDFTTSNPEMSLVPPFTLSGCVREPGSVARYSVKLIKGQSIHLQIESRALELPLTPVLRVVDSAGKVLGRVEPAKPNADCELSLVPTRDETVSVEVRDLYRAGGSRYVFRLRCTPTEPDFEASISSDRHALTPGTPLEIPITLTAKGGLPSQLTGDYVLKTDGLPAKVKAEYVPVDPKDKAPAKDRLPKLKLTADEGVAASSAIRASLVAKLKNGTELVRAIRAPLAEFETTTSDLWLTVGTDAKVATPAPKKKR